MLKMLKVKPADLKNKLLPLKKLKASFNDQEVLR